MAIATLTVALQAQIAEFQADFKKAAKSTEEFQKDFQATATKASAYGNLIATGVQLGIEAFGEMGAAVLENASNIKDLSHKTGLAMGTIQEFQFVAEQTGTTVDAFADAAFKLGTNLAGGSDSVQNAVKKLGLEFKDLNAQSIDEKFKNVTTSLGKMDDQQERNRLGVILMGRVYKEVAAGVDEGYAKLAAGAKKAADEQIVALSDAENAWKDFKRNALTSVTSFAGEAVLQYRLVDSALKDMGGRFNEVAALLPGNTTGLLEYADALRRVQQRANEIDLSRVVQEMQQDALRFLTLGDRTGGATILQPGTADYRAVEADLAASLKRQNAAWDEAASVAKAAMDKAKAAAEAYRESVINLRDEFSGAKLGAEVRRMEDAFRLLTDEQRKSPDVQDRVGEAAERLRQNGANLSPELLTLAVRTQAFSEWLNKVPGQTDRWATSFDTLRTALEKPLVQLQGMDEAIAQIDLAKIGNQLNFSEPGFFQWENTIDWDTQIKPAKDGLGAAFKDIAPGLINILGDALTSGASRHKWEEVGTSIGALIGGAIGGTFAGPVGAAVGAQIGGAIGGWIGSMFDVTDYEIRVRAAAAEMKKIIEDELGGLFVSDRLQPANGELFGNAFFSTAQLDLLRARFDFLGLSIDEALRARDPVWLRRVLDEANAKLEIFNANLGTLSDNATGAGITLDASMRPYIQRAIDAGIVTDELGAKLLGMTRENSMNWREMQSLAEKYGIELSGLGHTFQQQKLTETAADIIRDFDRLIGNGADFNAVLHGMTDEIQGVVTQSLKFGTEIPENMRPWIEALIKSGDLVDENGQKITDIGKLKFGPEIKSDVDKLIDAIRELIDKIGLGLPAALTSLTGRRFPPIRIPIEFEVPGSPDPSLPQMAHGGIVRRPTLALIGEAGPEAVIPLNQLGSFGAQTGKSTVILEVDGRVLAEATVPHFPGVVRHHVRPR